MNDMSMEEAMEGFSLNKVKDGDILEGTILKVNKDEVIVNINYFADGVVPREELTNDHHEDITSTHEVGDKIKVIVLKSDDGEGNVLLSKLKADAIVSREELQKALEDKTPVTVKVEEVVKGGLRIFYNGLSGFMPASLVSDSYVEDLKAFEGKKLEALVEEYDEEQNKLIFSRKALLKIRGEKEKARLLKELKEGESIEGTVSNITSYGAFIDLGGLIGLAHISDLSYGRINHPSEVVKGGLRIFYNGLSGFMPASLISDSYVEDLKAFEGKKLEALVEEYDEEQNKLIFSRKALLKIRGEKEKARLLKELKEGESIEGTVSNITSYGAFIDLGGLIGLAHISDLSYGRINHPSEVVSVGDSVVVHVLKIDRKNEKISLSLKSRDEDPWNRVHEMKVGQVYDATVKKIIDAGAIVQVDGGVDGLVHISEISHDHVTDVHDILKEGQKIKVKLLGIDDERRRVSFSIRDAQEEDQSFYDNEESVTIGDVFKNLMDKFTGEE